jgi:hypothetical protein
VPFTIRGPGLNVFTILPQGNGTKRRESERECERESEKGYELRIKREYRQEKDYKRRRLSACMEMASRSTGLLGVVVVRVWPSVIQTLGYAATAVIVQAVPRGTVTMVRQVWKLCTEVLTSPISVQTTIIRVHQGCGGGDRDRQEPRDKRNGDHY